MHLSIEVCTSNATDVICLYIHPALVIYFNARTYQFFIEVLVFIQECIMFPCIDWMAM